MQGTSTALDDRAAIVKKAILDIRCKSEELLSKNVDFIKQQNTGQTYDVYEAFFINI